VNRRLSLALRLFFFFLAPVLSAWGNKEVKYSEVQMEKSNPVQEIQDSPVFISGKVRLVGSHPFPDLVITGLGSEWYIDKEDVDKLKDLQHRTVTVEGLETVKALILANGRPAGELRTLKIIRIINID
jgi:hypothetical protein